MGTMAQIIWTDPAAVDLEEIRDYIARFDSAAATKLFRKVVEKVRGLQYFPEIGTKPREFSDRRYRQLTVRPLRIFYRYEADTVFIIYVMRAERLLKFSDLEERDV